MYTKFDFSFVKSMPSVSMFVPQTLPKQRLPQRGRQELRLFLGMIDTSLLLLESKLHIE